MIRKISNFMDAFVKSEYTFLIFLTIVIYFIIKLISKIIFRIYMSINDDSRDRFLYKQKLNILSNIIFLISTFFLWETHLSNIITLISFISAGATIALREIIFNFFSGIYIKIKKPFQLEDRIEIGNDKGDVINISNLSFEILEIANEINGEQSTGKIIHLPNSVIFNLPLKNYVKAFKYIWNEITIKIPLDADVLETKKVLYKIINNNQVIKRIPQKMLRQINGASLDYRIYFNNFEPIIYTKVVDSHIELYVRYLIHPKKARNVENEIWLDILKSYKNEEIVLLRD
ncbi:MAG: mechanosensitive ion channel [Tenericutes bacterium]|nr:mechanosensitive ion channel [Mycoplasmatota bacterium]